MMRKFAYFSAFCFLVWFFMGLEDIFNPSDSGDMKWLNYTITKYKVSRGDIPSTVKLGSYYDYNGEYEKNSKFMLGSVRSGYGGIEKPWNTLLEQILYYCSHYHLISPDEVAESFAAVRQQGGGLTEEGKALESRWKANRISDCPAVLK